MGLSAFFPSPSQKFKIPALLPSPAELKLQTNHNHGGAREGCSHTLQVAHRPLVPCTPPVCSDWLGKIKTDPVNHLPPPAPAPLAPMLLLLWLHAPYAS
jgi:hypothetical protein